MIVTRLRPSILLGPRNNNFAREMGRLRAGIEILEGIYLPVVHEEDVIDAFELAIDKDVPGAFIISLPEPVSMKDLLDKKPKKPPRLVPLEAMIKFSRMAYTLRLSQLSPDWVIAGDGNWRFDLTRSREVLGWEPKHDLATTIAEMKESLKAEKKQRKVLKRA